MKTSPTRPHEGLLPKALTRFRVCLQVITMRMIVFLAALATLSCQGALQPIPLSDDGGWCWFEDERVLIHDGKLIVGSVASGFRDPSREGNIEALTYDLSTGERRISVLHQNLSLDDHNSPAFLVRPDGRLLALYAKHGSENRFHYRISADPGETSDWRPELSFAPSESSRITYSNPHCLSEENSGKGRIYNFYRGLNNSFKPSYAFSDDYGESWTSGNVVIDVPSELRHRPYVKYASNGKDTVHFFYTEGHPRDYDNSVYHVYYRGGNLRRSDGAVIRSLEEGLSAPSEGTLVFAGDPANVAWVSDVHLDESGRPYGAFSVQKEPECQDHRYHYARWTGAEWVEREMAYAGTCLYAREADYTGLVALDPDDANVVFISTDADPASGEPLVSVKDQRRHYEIYRGVTADAGATWEWTPITKDSTADNLRPIVPAWSREKTALVWLRGVYRTYTDYDLEVVGLIF